MAKSAILLGASGLIGNHLLKLLLEDNEFNKITVIVRKPLAIKHKKLTQIITDFSNLQQLKDSILGDVLFSCLGSTKSKTPNKAEYLRIDKDIPLQIAKFGKENNVSQLHLVSSIGANSNSSNFYTKMKGEIEEELKEIKFQATFIYQPSLLRGNRSEKRIGENIALLITSLIDPVLPKKYKSINIEIVAQAMLNQANKNLKGTFCYPSDKIKELV